MNQEAYHVVVVGAGAAGIAAAVCASRRRRRTLLLEKNSGPGGLAVAGRITTICGLYRNAAHKTPEFLYDGFPKEFAEKILTGDNRSGPVRMGRVVVLQSRFGIFENVARCLLASQKELDVRYKAAVSGFKIENSRIQNLAFTVNEESVTVQADVVIDCTGGAAVCRMAAAPVIWPDEEVQGPAIVFTAADPENRFSDRATVIQTLVQIRRGVDAGQLPAGCESVSFLPEPGGEEVVIKLNLGLLVLQEKRSRGSGFNERAESWKQALTGFLQRKECGLGQVRFSDQPGVVLHRAGARAAGMYRLTRQDVLSAARFPDAVARGNWPIETYPSSGGPQFAYLPEGTAYDIPERCLRIPGIENLLVAGRCISADDHAAASARVIGCCLATGEGAGLLAGRTGTEEVNRKNTENQKVQ